ncbi:breast cancer anti-estrogen resistance protein 3 homolog isoform X2 [Oncorhynchus mykiss]|uniref:SH2 domain containing 3A n=1 Tax=Oncorhynchus mykiss TaxID=8022 RepID=A0A8L0DRJ7_ONCMY|nr:breast cancer anti-estrogen resistance protein 3 homolog isoform X2 [Oncorhynchus mykiss]
MNNRSIAWWLKQIGLPQYTKSLEGEYYGLEGLLYVCDVDLKEAGVDDPSHRDTILSQLLRHRQTLDPHSGMVEELRVSRKYSLGSSLDLVKPRKDLFRQSVLPRLRRKVTVSASCSQLHPLEEGLSPGLAPEQTRKRSKRRSVTAYLSQLKVFGGSREMDSLKKELEEELKLSTNDLRSHAWYHGPIGREGAEALLERDGDFLVRDTASSPGDYVLSCYWKDEPMHFKIIKVVLRPKKGYSRELFQFEGDRFDNIPALVRFHVGGRHPVSQASGAIVYHPITRSLPIRVISERQAERTESNRSSNRSSNCALDRVGVESQPDRNKRLSFNSSHMDTLHVTNTLLRSGSQPANLENLGRRPSIQSAQSESNLRTGAPHSGESEAVGPAPISPVFRTGSEPLISPSALRHTRPSHPGGGVTLRGSDGQLHPRAPPKPFRVSTFFPGTPPNRHRDDPYDELVIQVPESKKRGHVDRLRAEEKWQSRARLTETSFSFLEAQESGELPRLPIDGQVQEEEEDSHFQRPQVETVSCFRLDQFESLLLPENNRPLDPTVLMVLKELFTRSNAMTTALHILSVDCQVARIVGVTEDQKRMMGVGSGLELVTLSHGQQLRQDLLERHHLLALGVAIDILGCTGTVGQRATVLHKVILLAQALRDHAHNLYAFSAVMKALEMPQVVRLERTWRALRRNHTESAVMFEKTLKPFMIALNDGDDSVVQGPLAVPYLVPLLRLMEGEEGEHTERGCQLLYNTLQAARNAALHAPQYQEHAHSLLTGDWEPIPELLEGFRTEFALRLFWGQTGAAADKEKRYDKFDKILTVLSNKLEPTEEFSPEL